MQDKGLKDVFEPVVRSPTDPWASQVKSLMDKMGCHVVAYSFLEINLL